MAESHEFERWAEAERDSLLSLLSTPLASNARVLRIHAVTESLLDRIIGAATGWPLAEQSSPQS
jgi:hypothetical protein